MLGMEISMTIGGLLVTGLVCTLGGVIAGVRLARPWIGRV